ncbi:MAG: pseudouridine synthase [Bacteroidales bacterium]|nr:pseudouridine synthase [Bacteroidales bacterium]
MPNYILHKPYGYLSQFVRTQTTRKNKKLLGVLHDFSEATMAIGRLDEDSEGLLLLTTDGKLSEKVRSKSVEKEYYAEVDGLIDLMAIEQLKKGVLIGVKGEKYQTKKCQARLIENPEFPERSIRVRNHRPTSWLSITISEGKFRQVRKMTAAVGFPTLRLVRVRIGNLKLLNFESGKVVEIDNDFDSVFVG